MSAPHTYNGPFNVWRNMKAAVVPELRYLLDHHERWVHECKRGRAPSKVARPIKVWPDGRCRIEFGGTFPTIRAAYLAVKQDIEAQTKK